MGILAKIKARKAEQAPKRCMQCYAEMMAELTWQERLRILSGEQGTDVGLVPYDGDCEYKHFRTMSRQIRRKAREALAGTPRKRSPRKQVTQAEQPDNQPVDAQGNLFR